jgi:hypothetical protein
MFPDFPKDRSACITQDRTVKLEAAFVALKTKALRSFETPVCIELQQCKWEGGLTDANNFKNLRDLRSFGIYAA